MARLYASLFSAILLLSLCVTSAWAQTATIAGKVLDRQTGEALPGVAVQVTGPMTKGIATDLNGQYSLKVDPGTYTIVFTLVGYSPIRMADVAISSGLKEINVSLSESAAETEEVVLTNQIVRQSTEALQMEIRNAPGLESGISADLIRRTPDNSVADALRRVSGATIQDDKFAVVRGLPDRYNAALLNGGFLASTEAEKKAINLDLFAANLIDKIIISKTATPDLPGDFAGGLVKIFTKDIPYTNSTTVGFSLGTHSLTTGKDYMTDPAGGPSDHFGYDQTRQLPDGLPSRAEMNQQYIDAGRNTEVYADLAKRMPSHNYRPDVITAPLARSLSLGHARRIKLGERMELGIIASAVYRESYTNTRVQNQEHTNYQNLREVQDKDSNYLSTSTTQNRLAGIGNAILKINNFHKIGVKNFFTLASDQTVFASEFNKFINGRTEAYRTQQNAFLFQSNRLRSHQLTGEHLFGKSDGPRLEYTLSYLSLYRQQPHFRKLAYVRAKFDGDETFTPAYAVINTFQNANNYSPGSPGTFFSSLNEDTWGANASLAVPFNLLLSNEFKVGTLLYHRTRSFVARNFVYFYDQTRGQQAALRSQLFLQGPDSIFAPQNFSRDLFFMTETSRPSDNYNARGHLYAGFAQMEHKFEDKVRVIYGTRLERYFQGIETFQDARPVKQNTLVTDWLPSANIIITPRPWLAVRGAWSRTVSRPEFRELANFAFYEITFNSIVIGNPNLRRTRIENYDLRFEFYPSEGVSFSINPFYKKMYGPIETFIGTGQDIRQILYQNAPEGFVRGLELETRVGFGFVDGEANTSVWNNLAFFGNLSIMRSEVQLPGFEKRPIWGQSPYIINTGLSYSDPVRGWDALVTVNRFGRRIMFTAQRNNGLLWENPRTVLDFSVGKEVAKGLRVRALLGDILAQPLIIYQDLSDGSNPSRGANLARGIWALEDLLAGNKRLKPTDQRTYVFKRGFTTSLQVNYTF